MTLVIHKDIPLKIGSAIGSQVQRKMKIKMKTTKWWVQTSMAARAYTCTFYITEASIKVKEAFSSRCCITQPSSCSASQLLLCSNNILHISSIAHLPIYVCALAVPQWHGSNLPCRHRQNLGVSIRLATNKTPTKIFVTCGPCANPASKPVVQSDEVVVGHTTVGTRIDPHLQE